MALCRAVIATSKLTRVHLWLLISAPRAGTPLRITLTMTTFIQNLFVVLRNGETHHPTTGGPEDPIYFYDSDKPYYESAELSSASPLSPLMRGCSIPCNQVYKLL